MSFLVRIVEDALMLYTFAIFVRIILSWVPLRSGTLPYRLYTVLYDLTEPYLRLFRRFVPTARFGGAALDLSPLAGLVVLYIVQLLVAKLL
jgi:YggT family protein